MVKIHVSFNNKAKIETQVQPVADSGVIGHQTWKSDLIRDPASVPGVSALSSHLRIISSSRGRGEYEYNARDYTSLALILLVWFLQAALLVVLVGDTFQMMTED